MGFLGGSAVKNPPVLQNMQKTLGVPPLSQEDPLEEEMATQSSILALKNPMDRGVWQATAHRVTQSWTQLRGLSTHIHTHCISILCIYMYVCVHVQMHILCSIPIYFKAFWESSLEGNLIRHKNEIIS